MDKYTLWEVVSKSGNRVALVKTENILSNESKNYWYGKEICRDFFGYDYQYELFTNGGYEKDQARCFTIKPKKRRVQ